MKRRMDVWCLLVAVLCSFLSQPIRGMNDFSGPSGKSSPTSFRPLGDNIAKGFPKPHGTFAEFPITLSEKGAPVLLQVSTALPSNMGGVFTGTHHFERTKIPDLFPDKRKLVFSQTVSKKDAGGNFAKEFTAMVPGLLPDTKYFYAMQVTDIQGGVWIFLNYFETKVRTATIFINEIHIIDDSDPVGSGELSFSFFLRNEFVISLPTNGGSYDLGSGKTLNFGPHDFHIEVGQTHLKNGNGVTFRAIGFDDDESPGLGLNTCGKAPIKDSKMGNGENDCGEWSSGSTVLFWNKGDGTPLQTGPEENFKKPFSFKVDSGNGSELSFEVKGVFEVKFP